jgi:hypothetical protein
MLRPPLSRISPSISRERNRLPLTRNKLPKAEHDAEEWQAAMQALLLVAELDGPTMFARIGVMRALSRHVERCLSPRGRRSGPNEDL